MNVGWVAGVARALLVHAGRKIKPREETGLKSFCCVCSPPLSSKRYLKYTVSALVVHWQASGPISSVALVGFVAQAFPLLEAVNIPSGLCLGSFRSNDESDGRGEKEKTEPAEKQK